MEIVTIRLRDNGPLVIHGPVRVIDAEGREFTLPADKPQIALCRCGNSANKPFCDGAHKACNFASQERAGDDHSRSTSS
jgi:CDGSH-type Zn-finger protein